MKPVQDYASARCVAIMRDGRRCSGRWQSAMPCTYAWDPVKGVGIDAPYVVLCWRHSRMYERRQPRSRRIRVAGGWLGPYNEYDYGSAVWAAPSGWRPAPSWWAHRREAHFGGPFRRDAAA